MSSGGTEPVRAIFDGTLGQSELPVGKSQVLEIPIMKACLVLDVTQIC